MILIKGNHYLLMSSAGICIKIDKCVTFQTNYLELKESRGLSLSVSVSGTQINVRIFNAMNKRLTSLINMSNSMFTCRLHFMLNNFWARGPRRACYTILEYL